MADATMPPRALPHDIQAEMGVLGSMLLSPDALFLARERLHTESFYKLTHQDIFKAMVELFEARNTVDIILLRDELKQRDQLEKVGGVAYLTELMDAVPTSANAEYYIEIVRDHAVKRHLINTAGEILNASYSDGRAVEDLLDEAERQMLAVRHMREHGAMRQMNQLLEAVMERLDRVHQNPGQLTGVPSGFAKLDEILNGFQPGEFIVVAARPGMGKTSLVLNIMDYLCSVERRPAALYSLEMRAEQIVSNVLCIHNEIDTQDFRKGKLSDTQWKDIEDSIDDLQGLPLYLDDSPVLTVHDLRARARRIHHQHQVQFIAVDYLQLLMPNRTRDSRAVEVGEISAALKALARELSVPVVAVSQLNRAVEKEQREPRMSDLRESGAIEQDADVVIFLHRSDGGGSEEPDWERSSAKQSEVNTESLPGVPFDIVVAKQRNGPTGKCRLTFWKRFLTFKPG